LDAHGGLLGSIAGRLAGKEALESLQALMGSTAWRTLSPVLKAKLANYIAAGNQGAIGFSVQEMLKSTGPAAVSSRDLTNAPDNTYLYQSNGVPVYGRP
jgi:hypothetical protein